MSGKHSPPHRNKHSGELLLNPEQICPTCHLNLGTNEAGDKHLLGSIGVDRRCADPAAVGLVPIENDFGTKVWKVTN